MFEQISDCAAHQVADRVEWDELQEVAVIGIDSEGRRHVYANSGDYRALLWLSAHLEIHIKDEMAAAQRDVGQ